MDNLKNNNISCILTHAVYTKFTALATVIATAAMALVIGNINALSSTTLPRVLAFLLASAAICFVISQVHALVVATFPTFSIHFLTHHLVFVAVASRSRVFRFLC